MKGGQIDNFFYWRFADCWVFLQIEKKCDQMRKQLRKSDKEYCELCEKAEAARQEWEFNVAKVRLSGSRSCIEWHVHWLYGGTWYLSHIVAGLFIEYPVRLRVFLEMKSLNLYSTVMWKCEISIAKVTLKGSSSS